MADLQKALTYAEKGRQEWIAELARREAMVAEAQEKIAHWENEILGIAQDITLAAVMGEPITQSIPVVSAYHGDVVDATAVEGTVLLVVFSNGESVAADFSTFMYGPLFDELMQTGQFLQFRVDPEIGTIVWPNGLDVAPETIWAAGTSVAEELAEEPR